MGKPAHTGDLVPSPTRFPLDAYLVHLRAEKDAAQRAVADARLRLESEQQRLSDLLARREELRAEQRRWEEQLQSGLHAGRWTVAELRQRQSHLERLGSDRDTHRERILGQRRAIEAAERAVKDADEHLREIASETLAHERRKEAWLAEAAHERQRAEQKEIDQIGQAIHERRRRQDR